VLPVCEAVHTASSMVAAVPLLLLLSHHELLLFWLLVTCAACSMLHNMSCNTPDVQPPRLVVCAVAGTADLTITAQARHPGFNIKLAVCRGTQIARWHVKYLTFGSSSSSSSTVVSRNPPRCMRGHPGHQIACLAPTTWQQQQHGCESEHNLAVCKGTQVTRWHVKYLCI
jgi:hypothetical protein